jgi:hypothetical protein
VDFWQLIVSSACDQHSYFARRVDIREGSTREHLEKAILDITSQMVFLVCLVVAHFIYQPNA